MSLTTGRTDVFTTNDRALLNRVSALLDRGAVGSLNTPDAQQLRLTIFQNQTFAAGDPVYYGAGAWSKSLATDTDPAHVPIGIIENGLGSNVFTVVLNGHIRGLSGLTAGRLYFLADGGGLTLTPSPTNRIPVLFSLTTTTGLVLIQPAPLTVSRVGYADNNIGTSISIFSGSGLLSPIQGPFRCNFSAWVSTASNDQYIRGNAGVRWNANSAIYEIAYEGIGWERSGTDAVVTGSVTPPATGSGFTCTITLTGGAAGAYSSITDVTATLTGLPGASTGSGVSIAVDAPSLVSFF